MKGYFMFGLPKKMPSTNKNFDVPQKWCVQGFIKFNESLGVIFPKGNGAGSGILKAEKYFQLFDRHT